VSAGTAFPGPRTAGPMGRARSALPGISWPPLLRGPLATLAALVQHLDRSQWLSAGELALHQHRQLASLAAHAALHSNQFAGRLRAAGLEPADLATPAGLARLAPLRRRDIQIAGADFFCRALPAGHEPLRETTTSGSTGEPVVTRRTAVSQLFWRAFNLRGHAWFGRDLAGRCTAIRAYQPKVRVQESWGPPLDRLFKTGPLQAIPVRTDITEQVRLLREFRPGCLIAYPSNLDAIRRHCQREEIELGGIELILTMGEALSPDVRRDAVAFFGARLFDTYSSEELGNIAFQCPDSDLYHVMAEGILAEVLDAEGKPCAPGETGRLVLTDLGNFASPLIRYAIGDLAEVAEPCACGRGLTSLRRIAGRERNILRLPDGRRNWPFLGLAQYRAAAPVIQYQVAQTGLERIEMRLVTERALSATEEARLAEVLCAGLGHSFAVDFVYFPAEIPRPPSGKLEEFVCLLPAESG
jgi:phenylacetate-CoA ligase